MLLAIIVGGLYALRTISVDTTPDITDNQVQVITVSQNLGTRDIEQFVTFPVEQVMANLPGVTDIRSVSRSGLSVVTVVFRDDMGTYLPRQLVQEKLAEVKEQIPSQLGEPEMGPITTGLGEIFQYTLVPDDTAAYTPMQLRAIQDWIVKRQLNMIPGVVDINSFGGSIKQYEVAVSPDKLRSMHVSLGDVYDALKRNNGNAGGAYIERDHMASFIRGEGLIRSAEDIGNTVIRTEGGHPILIRDVADSVSIGHQVRYGAFTQDGHEAVGGMILMLKGANSRKVVSDVKKRIAEVQHTLPHGIKIKPFLDRSELISRTTSTIARNLIEGALIVIFVLVLLLGSLRGGLVAASVIPLSLSFAFILMRIFGVWVNLMSLGAIDFGIIVDGAVIIVEGTVSVLQRRLPALTAPPGQASQSDSMNQIVYREASTMMHSAFFGQLIILIVFVPVLFLTGVSGKMFQPMVFTFMFALLGAILLCLTYVPAACSLLMRPLKQPDSLLARTEARLQRLSRSIMHALYRLYAPALRYSLRHKRLVGSIAVLLFAVAALIFSRMGGEFIPSLDEGDIAMQTFLRPGSSLSETIKREEEVERLLLASFPEIKTVCARIGVADIPTDPMGFDFTDSFIILEKDRSKWTSAKTKEELIEKIKQRLSVLPGLNFSFSQPVALRFNELLTGIREDVAVKLYGEDLDTLNVLGDQMAQIISKIPGAEDVNIERTSGLPQMSVSYDRDKLAQYGLDISKINDYISAAFAGGKAGVVFEGEKRFDLVVRLSDSHRQDISDLRRLPIDLLGGDQIPLEEVADIHYQPGPMQISRDKASRFIYVGVNVRTRDVQSLVKEIRQRLSDQITLPPGYKVVYGGSFENLQQAKSRLAIVLPLALVIIFLLLYLALRSVRQSLMIYVAIPLSAIGGVLALAVRGMPFSISASVGFIVLFGVAVLNGLVLVNRFNSLRRQGLPLDQVIAIGTQERMRPILLTALSAMLGFMPMAVSTSAGAEVQRPIATVILGGLISATLLTLIILPLLYSFEEKMKSHHHNTPSKPKAALSASAGAKSLLLLALTLLIVPAAQAQPTISLQQAIDKALANYPALKAARLQVKSREALRPVAWDIGTTQLSTGAEEVGHGDKGTTTLFQVHQDLDILGIGARKRLQREQVAEAQVSERLSELELRHRVSLAYAQAFICKQQYQLYLHLDSVYKHFEQAAKLRYETEETSRLDYLSAVNAARQITLDQKQARRDYETSCMSLSQLMASDTLYTVDDALAQLPPLRDTEPASSLNSHPQLLLKQQQIRLAEAGIGVSRSEMLPKFYVEYGSQKIGSRTGFNTWQIGLSMPLVYGAQKARTRSATIERDIAVQDLSQARLDLYSQYNTLRQQYDKWYASVQYYLKEALPVAHEQQQAALLSYQEGATDYLSFIENMRHAVRTQLGYWNAYAHCLQTRFDLEYCQPDSGVNIK